MHKYRIIAFISALTIPLSLTSCRLRDFSKKSDSEKKTSEESEEETETKASKKSKKSDRSEKDDESDKSEKTETSSSDDLDEIREHVQNLLNDSKESDNEDSVKRDIEDILYDIDYLYEQQSLLSRDYTLNWGDEEYEDKYDAAGETLSIAMNLAEYAFCKCYENKEYAELVKQYVSEDYTDQFSDSSMNLKRIEGYTRVDFEIMDDYLDRYYDIAYDDSLDDDEKDIKCAELYLELLNEYDTETFYDGFNRDYSPELILELSETVRDEMLDAEDEVLDAFRDMDDYEDVLDDPVLFDDPFTTILEYSPELSDDIEDAAKLITDEKLYTIGTGDATYSGSYTEFLPLEDHGEIYMHDSEDLYTLSTAVHEFGHFYAYMDDTSPVFSMSSNVDIAEIQSQGFECIFTRFYDDIYGKQADAMKLVNLVSLIDSVTSGFAVGEFEYTVLKNRDELTPEEVVEKFDEIVGDQTNFHFWYVSHMFEQPGYYISYGVSALAAFDIWRDEQKDEDAALEKYERIADISSMSSQCKFQETLEECGFENVMSKEYISELADEIIDYAKSL